MWWYLFTQEARHWILFFGDCFRNTFPHCFFSIWPTCEPLTYLMFGRLMKNSWYEVPLSIYFKYLMLRKHPLSSPLIFFVLILLGKLWHSNQIKDRPYNLTSCAMSFMFFCQLNAASIDSIIFSLSVESRFLLETWQIIHSPKDMDCVCMGFIERNFYIFIEKITFIFTCPFDVVLTIAVILEYCPIAGSSVRWLMYINSSPH